MLMLTTVTLTSISFVLPFIYRGGWSKVSVWFVFNFIVKIGPNKYKYIDSNIRTIVKRIVVKAIEKSNLTFFCVARIWSPL